MKTKCRYNVGSSLGDTFAPIVSDISNEHAATVPTARCFELPKTAYMIGGTKLESNKQHQQKVSPVQKKKKKVSHIFLLKKYAIQ